MLDLKQFIDENKLDNFYVAIEQVQAVKLEVEAFRRLLLRTDLDIRANSKINWFELAQWYFEKNGRGGYYKNFKTSCNLDGSLSVWNINSGHIDVVMMFENFYKNAFEHGATFLDFFFSDKELVISSNSEKIDSHHIDNIFELGFSTKQNGTGIGLYQIKESLIEVGYNIAAKSNDVVSFHIYKE